MLRLAKAVVFFTLASGFVLLLSACGGGSGSNSPKPAAIAARASFPSSANAGASFSVSVSLTSSNRPKGTATVQLVDVSTVTPGIDCGASQTLAINGASLGFNCQAPQITLGSNNTHQLQVDVNGVANLSSPASINVVNGGAVDAQLTSTSGTAIAQAVPGQTIDVAFTTTTTPAGIGKYTVTAPSGWTAGNGGICNVNAQHTSCTVPVTVAASAVGGSYNFTIAAEQGSSALSATSLPVSVAVNSGEVDVEVTDVSGAVIKQATPGQTIGVAFTTTTTPAGTGTYTVSAPNGWTVGNGGICNVNAQNLTCRVPVTIASDASIGSYSLTVAAGPGASPLSATSLPISVQAQAASGGMAFDLAQNISHTLYANLPTSTTTFKYQPVFLFKNTSGSTLTIDSASVSGLTNVQYGCNIAAPNQHADYTLSATPDCTLTPAGLYAVSGDLNNSFSASPSTTAPVGAGSVSISVLGGGKTYVEQTANVVFVTYKPGYVAVNIKNSDGSPVYVAAVNGGNMITFDQNNIGTNSTDPSGTDFSLDQFTLPSTGGLLYFPYGISDVINLTHGITNAGVTTGFNTTAPPNPTGLPAPPPYLSVEMTYQQNVPGGQCTGTTCESLTVDQTYVNFFAVAGSFNLMGNTAPLALDTQASTHGTVTDLSQLQIMQNIKAFFATNGGSTWKYDPTRGQKNYIQTDQNGNPTWIFAPIGVYNTSFDPMASSYYDTYVSALWTYLETNPIYVFASGTGESDYKTPAPADDCVLKGQVVTAPPTDPNLGKLVFNYSSGTCPPAGYAIGPAPYQGALCGVQKNAACADGPNGLVFDKFNECDFSNAAGSGDCHPLVDPTSTNHDPQAIDPVTFPQNHNLWGPNGTYRAVVGRAIAAYQAIGLLPPCEDKSEVLSDVNARADIANGKGFKNPTTCLSGLGSDPTWNVYADALRSYANVYAYTYGDFLGLDGTVTFSANALPATLYQNIQVAQPITIKLH